MENSSNNDSEFDSEAIHEIAGMFIEELPERINIMANLVRQIENGSGSESVLGRIQELEKQTHKMVGTAGSLGFKELADLSNVLHSKLKVAAGILKETEKLQSVREIRIVFDNIQNCAKQSESEFLRV